MMPWLAIIEFVAKLFTGELWRVWQQHKQKEVDNARNNVDALNDNDLDKRVQSDITRK